MKPETLNDYYKNHLSDFHSWLQKPHAEDFTLYRDNIGRHLPIDETSLSNGELYTVVTNKAGHGRKGTLVAMIKDVGGRLCHTETSTASGPGLSRSGIRHHGHVQFHV